jgi:hypothetical protein
MVNAASSGAISKCVKETLDNANVLAIADCRVYSTA